MSRRFVLVTVGVVVGALALGVVASHALSGGGSDQHALPPLGPTQPLIAPNDGALGTVGPATNAAPATPANGVPLSNVVGSVQRYSGAGAGGASTAGSGASGASDGSGSAGSSGSSGGGDGGTATSTTAGASGAGGATTTTGASGSGAGSGSATTTTSGHGTTSPTVASGSLTDPRIPHGLFGIGLVQFHDPCADHAGCHGGFGGTILPIDDRYPAFRITSASSSFCPDADAWDADSPMFAVRSTAPGHFWAHVRGASDTTVRGSGFRTEGDAVSTSAAEVDRWNASGRTTDVVTCFSIPTGVTVEPTHQYTAHIEGVSEPDGLQHDAIDLTFTYQRGGRPPLSVEPGNLWPTDRIITTDIPGGPKRVPSVVLATSDPGARFAPHCTDDVRAREVALTRGADYPRAEFESPDYPYSRLYPQRFQPAFRTATVPSTGAEVPFAINTKYVLCISWADPSDGHVVETKEILLASPDRYQMQLRAKSVDMSPARRYTIDISTFGGRCRIHLTGNGAHIGYLDPAFADTDFDYANNGDPANLAAQYPNGATSCDQADPLTFADPSFAYGNPDGTLSMEVDVTLNGTTSQTSIWVPISVCSPDGSACPFQSTFHEDYTVSFGRHGTGMCGGSGGCEPPSESDGSVTLEVLFQHSALYHGGVPWEVDSPTPNPHYTWTGGGSY